MMVTKTLVSILTLIIAINLLSIASAVTITYSSADTLEPGTEGIIRIEVENTLSIDVENVVLTLIFDNTPFIPIGSSSDSVDELEEDEDELFTYKIKAVNDASPGSYQILYTLSFIRNDQEFTRSVSIGVTIIEER